MRRHLAALGLFVVAACVQVHQVVLRGRLPDHYDYWLQQFVHLALLRRALLGGEIPLWNPALAGGTPHLADPQVAVLYPLTALPLLVLAPEHVARLVIPLHITIAGAGAYALALSFVGGRAAALIAGLAYMLALQVVHVNSHTLVQQSAAWSPWVLWSLRRGIASRTNQWFAYAGVLGALQLASGAPVVWGFTTIIALVAALVPRTPVRRGIGGLAMSAVVSLTLSAAQLLPTIELLGDSRGGEMVSPLEALEIRGLYIANEFFEPSLVYATPEAAKWLGARAAEAGPVRFASLPTGAPLDGWGDLTAPDRGRATYLPPNVSAIYRDLDAFQGYLAIPLRRTADVFSAINDGRAESRQLTIRDARSPLVDLYGIRYFVTAAVESPAERLRPVFAAPGVRIWENPDAYPFAWWSPVSPPSGTEAPDPRGIVAVLRRSFNAIDLEVRAPAPGRWVVNQMVAPGWRAFVAGRRAPLASASGAQLAVMVEPGTQGVMFRYLPAGAVVGAAVTGGMSASLAIWLLSSSRRAAARRAG